MKQAGQNSIAWNGMDDNGRKVSSGVYLYRIESNNNRIQKKMILMK